ncbi:MAG: glycosyltransferase family 2 protein [Lachnospiraceae bacterium]
MKKISIIVPCYNATKWLPKCFMSLVTQTMPVDELELIFVNDASTDDGATWRMLTELETTYPESIIIIDLPENRRQGGARNEAIKYASGEYIAFVDADDWIVENMCQRTYEVAKKNNADIVQFNHLLFFEGKGTIKNPLPMKEDVICVTSDALRKQMLMGEKLTYGCWNKLYRREIIEKSGVQYAEHCIYEEPLFVYPLLFYANKFVIIDECLYVYRQNNLGTMRNDMKEKKTLNQHADVQLAVWNYMKTTSFFKEYYEEIKAYFLHTYLYEYLDFAKKREMEVDESEYRKMVEKAKAEVQNLSVEKYNYIFKKQNIVYRLLEDDKITDAIRVV